MDQRPLGKTGLSVSSLGFGCGNVGGLMVRGSFEDQVTAVRRAIESGITYFDTAAQYGNGLSEQNLGRVLKHLDAWGKVRVGTKFRLDATDLNDPAQAMRRSVVESLRRLNHDSIDLIQLHNATTLVSRENASIALEHTEAVVDGMSDLVRDGLTHHIGLTGLGDTEALRTVMEGGRFETVQAYFNALNPSYGYAGASGGAQDFGGLIDVASGHGMGVIAIRVMAGGALSGSEERAALASPTPGDLVPGAEFSRDVERARRLAELAAQFGLENALELGIRFALAKEGVSTVLVGFSDMEQLEAALRWTERGPLSQDAVERVVQMAAPGQLLKG